MSISWEVTRWGIRAMSEESRNVVARAGHLTTAGRGILEGRSTAAEVE